MSLVTKIRPRLVTLTVLLLIIIVATYLYYDLARFFEVKELERFPLTKGYISDEVWYVNSARNILRRIFDANPRMDKPYATLIFISDEDVRKALEFAELYGIKVVGGIGTFSKIKAIYIEAPSINTIEAFARAVNATDVVYGWIIGDNENINVYANLEHPPMVKYIIALLMYIVGDRPIVWRIPSIIMGVLMVVFTFLLVYEVTKSLELALIAAAAVAVDPMTKAMASIALLDIYVAAFTVLTLYLAAKGRFNAAVLTLGFASTFKFTALTAAIPLLLIYINKMFRRGLKPADAISNGIIYLILMVLSFIFFQVVSSIPLIFGIRTIVGGDPGKSSFIIWLEQSIFGAISWHLTAKCLDITRCPIYSAPWEWFFGINSFVLYLSPVILAQGFTPIYAVSFVLMIFAIPAMSRENKARTLWYMLFGIFLGYLIIWVLGGRTQYSFYAVQLTPLIYAYTAVQIHEYVHRENIVLTLNLWKKVLTSLANVLLSLVR